MALGNNDTVFILLLFLKVFCFLLSGAQHSKSEKITCEVGAFLEPSSEKHKAVQLDGGPIPGADHFQKCNQEDKEYCKHIADEEMKMVKYVTKGGNLSMTADSKEGYTIGDYLCDKAESILEEQVQNKEVRMYWRFCGSAWARMDFKMGQQLCCEDGLYVPCKDSDSTRNLKPKKSKVMHEKELRFNSGDEL